MKPSGIIQKNYLRHDWVASFVCNIAERHLGGFVLIDLQLREINIRDLVQRCW